MDGLASTLSQTSLWLLQHLPSMVFIFCLGACVGSFLNVVVYRLPAGMSVISPPSRCPTCGARLKFFQENLPILGWFLIRGRCRYCGVKVSPQYMVIELLVALAFLGIYAIFFMTRSTTPWWSEVGGPWWTVNQVYRVWPSFLLVLFLCASLVAMTLIDARTFTIPIQIPLFVTFAAFILYPLQTVLPHRTPSAQTWPIPGVDWTWAMATAGGLLGVVLGVVLLKTGVLKYSFADYHEYVEDDEPLGDYPHGRREMLREIVYLAPIVLLCVVGAWIGSHWTQPPPEIVQAFAASGLGYLVGGGIVWAVRILGTLAFGREAMGLGDVHLLGAVGAVLGWFDPLVIFFVAPFSGLLWVLVSKGLSSVLRTEQRELPYGPHLAIATVLLLFGRPVWNRAADIILPGVELPRSGLMVTPDGTQAEDRRSIERMMDAADNLTFAQRSWTCFLSQTTPVSGSLALRRLDEEGVCSPEVWRRVVGFGCSRL